MIFNSETMVFISALSSLRSSTISFRADVLRLLGNEKITKYVLDVALLAPFGHIVSFVD